MKKLQLVKLVNHNINLDDDEDIYMIKGFEKKHLKTEEFITDYHDGDLNFSLSPFLDKIVTLDKLDAEVELIRCSYRIIEHLELFDIESDEEMYPNEGDHYLTIFLDHDNCQILDEEYKYHQP